MIRKIGIVAFGVLVAVVLIVVVEMIGHSIYPPPPGTDFSDPDAVKAIMDQAPVGALLLVITAYVIAAFGGGLLAALVARETPLTYVTTVGAFVLAGTVLNLFMIPHPAWFTIAAPAAVAATIFGTGRIAAMLVTDRHA